MIKLTTEIDVKTVYLRAGDVCAVAEAPTGGAFVTVCNGVTENNYRVRETADDVRRAVEAEIDANSPT